MNRILAGWQIPGPPEELKAGGGQLSLRDIEARLRAELARQTNAADRARLELMALEWLYDLVTTNVKRGRSFRLKDALCGRADCLYLIKSRNRR